MTVIIFFAVLFVLILVHEWGHFIVAKKTGMRVDEFGIGFPPRLFSKKWHDTEYTFNLLPIGGFVRIYGENAEDAAEDAQEGKTVGDAFTAKSKWAQAAVLIAGVTMNILFAWLLFSIVFMMGVATAVSPEDASDDARLTITNVLPESPAAIAEIPLGAKITALSTEAGPLEVLTPEAFSERTSDTDGEITVTYMHSDVETTVSLTPVTGLIADDAERPALGVALALIETVKKPIHIAMYDAVFFTGESLVGITVGLSTLIAQSVKGTADFSQVAGPVGIVGMVGDAAQFGLTALLMFTAVISLNLAVINLLPFPALDGGRLVFVAIEAIIRRPINPVWVARVNALGFLLLMVLMVAVTWNDIARLL